VADLISLGIKVTNAGITATSTALDKLAASAERAGAAVDKLPKNLSTADTSAKAATKSAADLTSTLDKASFGDAQIYKANQSLNKFKQAIQQTAEAAAKTGGFTGGLSDSQLLKLNQSLGSYKKSLQDVAEQQAKASAFSGGFSDAQLLKVNQSLTKYKQTLQDVAEASSKPTVFTAGLSDAALTKANAGLSNYKAGLDAVRNATAAAAKEDADAATRISDMVKASLARVAAENSVANSSKGSTAATVEQAAANRTLIEAQNRAMAASTALANSAKNNNYAKTQKDELSALIGQIDPTVAALNKLDLQQQKLNAFKKSGAISGDDFKVYSAAIDQARLKVTSAAGAVEKFTFNSAASRRELGLLVKDLATGQVGNFERSALTLANTSGVLGAAFSLTGLAVAGLVAGIGGLAAAYVVGSGEATEFSKAIILTGNAAGLTTDQYADMAKAIGATGVGQHAAAEALAEVASTGTFTASQIGEVTKAAVELEHVGGQAVADTVKQFVKLSQDPVKASAELNKQYGYLTTSVYDQIVALEEQGKSTEAVDLAVKAYADSINDRTPQITANLGLVQQAWVAVKGGVIGATNAVLDFGRAETGSEQVSRLQSQIALINKGLASGGLTGASANSAKQQLAELTNELVSAQYESAEKQGAAAAQGVQTEFNKRYTAYQQEATKYQSETSKLQTQIKANQIEGDKLYADAIASGNTEAAKEIKARQTLIDQGLKSRIPKGPKGGNIDNAENSAQLQDFKDSLAATTAAFADQQKVLDAKRKGDLISQADYYTQSEKLAQDSADAQVAAINKEIAVLQARSVTGVADVNNQKKIAELQADAAKIEADAVQKVTLLHIDEQAETKKSTDAINNYIAALQQQTDAHKAEVQAQVDSISMGDKEYARLQDLNKITEEAAKQQLNLAKARSEGRIDQSTYDTETKALQDAVDQRVKIEKDGFNQIDAAQSNWLNGANKAYQNFADEAADTAGTTQKIFTDAFNGLSGVITDFITKGKADFKGFLDSLVAEIVQAAVKKQLADTFGSFFGLSGSAGGDTSGKGGSLGSISDLFSGSFLGFAKGGAFGPQGQIQAFANGGIVDSPSFFGFGNGSLGVVGEAGEEGILPLRRGPNGKLGVESHGGQSGGGKSISLAQTFVVAGAPDKKTRTQLANENGRAISTAIRRTA
jgi:lambda family phage tail tape measure protein